MTTIDFFNSLVDTNAKAKRLLYRMLPYCNIAVTPLVMLSSKMSIEGTKLRHRCEAEGER